VPQRCPKCGGTNTKAITPGLYECQEHVVVGVLQPGQPGNPGITPQPVPGVCGHRFQIAVPGVVERCQCGRQAIGRCVDCGEPLCGLHGTGGGDLLCAKCAGERQAKVNQAEQEAKQAADRDRVDLLASQDPAGIASGAAAITNTYIRAEAAGAWQAYLTAASPAAHYDRVRIEAGSRWKLPAELGREPLWHYKRVANRVRAHGSRVRHDHYFVDRAGNGYSGSADVRGSVSGSCVIPAGAALSFERYGRGTDGYGLQKIRVATPGAMSVSEGGGPAPAVLLISVICELAGQPKEFQDMAWSLVPGQLRGR
jgi:hypothetical protein